MLAAASALIYYMLKIYQKIHICVNVYVYIPLSVYILVYEGWFILKRIPKTYKKHRP